MPPSRERCVCNSTPLPTMGTNRFKNNSQDLCSSRTLIKWLAGKRLRCDGALNYRSLMSLVHTYGSCHWEFSPSRLYIIREGLIRSGGLQIFACFHSDGEPTHTINTFSHMRYHRCLII